ncbi:MAG: hypothetical protein WCO22_07025 [Betaproteobacteria bacterium]
MRRVVSYPLLSERLVTSHFFQDSFCFSEGLFGVCVKDQQYVSLIRQETFLPVVWRTAVNVAQLAGRSVPRALGKRGSLGPQHVKQPFVSFEFLQTSKGDAQAKRAGHGLLAFATFLYIDPAFIGTHQPTIVGKLPKEFPCIHWVLYGQNEVPAEIVVVALGDQSLDIGA